MNTFRPARTASRPAFARWLGTTNDFTRNEPEKQREGVKRLAAAVKAMQTNRN